MSVLPALYKTKSVCSYTMISSNKHQVMKMGEKLQGLQEEKHQLFLQLKKVLHEEEKRRRKEQRFLYILHLVCCFVKGLLIVG